MDPFSLGLTAVMGAVSMGASVLGAMTQAAGANFQAQAQANEARYKAQIANINSTIAKQNADYERRAGEVVAQKAGLTAAHNIGQTRAIWGSRNLDIAYGSPAQVITSMQDVARQDQSLIRSNALRKAYGHEVEAFQETSKGRLLSASAENALTAGRLGVASSILGGISSVSSKWLQGNQVGMWGPTQPIASSTVYNG
jgi:hypothetical protein